MKNPSPQIRILVDGLFGQSNTQSILDFCSTPACSQEGIKNVWSVWFVDTYITLKVNEIHFYFEKKTLELVADSFYSNFIKHENCKMDSLRILV